MPITPLAEIKENFIQGLSQISQYWGFPKSMGAIFAVLYISPSALSLDEIVVHTGFTKGAISTGVRSLARMGLIHRQSKLGDRKDYYIAESDFYKAIRTILKGRENSEFDRALSSVRDTLGELESGTSTSGKAEEWNFVHERVGEMQSFFDGLDNLVRVVAALDTMNQNTVQKVVGLLKK
ncbi:MAG: hypothetical protein H8E29_05685 [Anaerolineales bacterium]|uniref:HTH-type transcriptional regulator n=1 Tax=Candidatus Desulfolinea nitratireducens TaxID=2841698 RepID=A0A8J6TE58_9CHLR|nr:hypothetical protein [Candidatus Desulfolinea nitratireducens]